MTEQSGAQVAEQQRQAAAAPLFRTSALADRSGAESLDAPLRVVSSRSWVVLGLLGLLCGATAAWAFVGRVDERLDLTCALVLSGERTAVVSAVAGSVDEVLTESGNAVVPGEPIARVWSAEADRRFDLVSPAAGELTFDRLDPGRYVDAGETVAWVRSSTGNNFVALAYASLPQVREVEAGMEAKLLPLGGDAPIAAVVHDVPTRPAADSQWLVELGLPDPRGRYLIEMQLAEQPEGLFADGELCQIGIVVNRRAPASLLTSLP